MVSLSTPRTAGPLVTRLASSPRPALVQEPGSPDGATGRDAAAHGTVDQRIELSGAVVVNWAAKAAGLLLDEGVGAGDEVHVDLPDHWLSRALALGVLCAGAEVAVDSGAEPGDAAGSPAAVLTDRPGRWDDPSLTVVAVALPRGLEPDFGDGAADPSVVDLAAEIRAQPDALPGPVGHIRPESVVDAAPTGSEAVPGRARLTARTLRATLQEWDAGRAAHVPA